MTIFLGTITVLHNIWNWPNPPAHYPPVRQYYRYRTIIGNENEKYP